MQLSVCEELIEFLNFKRFTNSYRGAIKDLIDEFRYKTNRHIPTSTAYRIVKKYNDEQQKLLNAHVNVELLKITEH